MLRAISDNVLLEVEKTFDFFKATSRTTTSTKIMLCGGASRVDGFAAALRDRFDTEVESFNPFRAVVCDAKKLGIEDLESSAPVAAVAVGLALRREGDRK